MAMLMYLKWGSWFWVEGISQCCCFCLTVRQAQPCTPPLTHTHALTVGHQGCWLHCWPGGAAHHQ